MFDFGRMVGGRVVVRVSLFLQNCHGLMFGSILVFCFFVSFAGLLLIFRFI